MDASWFKSPGPDDLGFDGKCNAKKRVGAPTGGERCRAAAGWRTTHVGIGPCAFHGGATPQAANKYERVAAGQLLHGYGLLREGDCDPRDLLMEELARTAGAIDYLTLCLADLTEDELLGKVPLPTELETGADKDGDFWKLREAVGVPVMLELYRWERAHLAKLSAEAVKLGLLERAVRVEEAQAALMATAMQRALQKVGLSADQLAEVGALLREELMELEAEQAPAVNQWDRRRALGN
jgi:hypothetical protein